MKTTNLKFLMNSLILFILICLFALAVKQTSISKAYQLNGYSDNYSALKIPERPNTKSDYQKLVTILSETTSKYDLFYMKKVMNNTQEIKDGFNFKFISKIIVTYYIPNNGKESRYNPPLTEAEFKFLSIADSIKDEEFEGQFFISTKEDTIYTHFIKDFSLKYNETFKTTYKDDSFSDFNNEEVEMMTLSSDTYGISNYLPISILFLFFISFFWLYSLSETISILRRNGFSIISILNTLIKKQTFIIHFLFFILTIFLCQLYHVTEMISFIATYFFLLFIIYGYLYGCTLFFTYWVSNPKQLYKKCWNLLRSILPYTIKAVFLISLLAISSDISDIIFFSSNELKSSFNAQENLQDDYYVFYPLAFGKNYSDFVYTDQLSIDMDDALYHELNQQGSLLMNIQHYLTKENKFWLRHIFINPNYLKEFPLLDEYSKKIDIAEAEEQRILLIPQKYKDQEQAIKDYYWQPDLQNSNIGNQIIWLKDHQAIYTFDQKYNWITDYNILLVLTETNSDYFNRNIIDGDMNPPLKVKYNQKIGKKIKKILKENHLDDNLMVFTPYQKANLTFLKIMGTSLNKMFISTFVLFFIFFIMSFFTSIYYFNLNGKKLALLRLNGYSFFATYKSYFFILIMQLPMVMILKYIQKIDSTTFFINLFLYLLIELIVSVGLLFFIERKSKLKMINGG
ncbi:DUF1430 domain-containing protein [Carnobacterium gallinarum]|uniref:DUF1430 domain-containing protein n=1 Tax=Carnobacterium gallinarum TaxID=2749 RepID=UPI000555FBE1|nr:DUF1430 domain-containing protein [Carnobacterium gallinarum]